MSTITQALLDNEKSLPDRTAFILLAPGQPEERITYHTLIQGAAGYAHALDQKGIHPGEVVVLVLQHGSDLVYSFFGAILHGAIPSIMPFLTEKLSPERYQEDMKALIQITRPAAIVTYPEFLPVVNGALRAGDSVRCVLATDRSFRPGDQKPIEQAGLASLRGLERSAGDIVLLQHSSGTTGLQKGVALSHQAVLNQLDAYADAIRLSMDDVIVSWLPLYHDMGLIAGFIMPALNRVPLVLMSPFDWVRSPVKLMQAVSQYHGTLTWLPNFAYHFCSQKIRTSDLEGVDLSSWRAVINCSEPMRWESHQLFQERFRPYGLRPEALATCYAMAENVFAVSQGGIDGPVKVDEIDARAFITQRLAVPLTPSPFGPYEHSKLRDPDHPSGGRAGSGAPKGVRDTRRGMPAGPGGPGETIKMLSAGRPIANTQARVLDEKHCQLPDRLVGEIALSSNCMLTGYYRRDDLTRKAFHDGWYLTGDLGYMLDGEVFVVGRKKDLIIIGGKNIYPQDLEVLANQVPGVHPGRVVAFGVFNPEIGTEEAVVVAEADLESEDERQRLADEVRTRVTRGSDVALRYVHLVGPKWIIKTSSGKIARLANRDKYLKEREEKK
jgi:acyl-CoA synthetase (AMP-forming)/AMP-acid ligase II